MYKIKVTTLGGVFAALLAALCQSTTWAGGLNLPPDSDGGKICDVTTTVDDEGIIGSLRRALNQGYNIQGSGQLPLCSEKITINVADVIRLKQPIVLGKGNFTLEKNPSQTGEVILDGTDLPPGTPLLDVQANRINLSGFTIQNPNGPAIRLAQGVTDIVMSSMNIRQSSQDGIIIENNVQNVQLNHVTVSQSTQNGVSIGNNVQDVQFNQVEISNSQQNGILVGMNAHRFQLNKVDVGQNRKSGVVFGAGAENNLVQDGSIHDNGEFGVVFLDSNSGDSRDLVSHDALYNNASGPLSSPNTQLTPSVTTLVDNSIGTNGDHTFVLTGNLQSPVDRLEIFKLALPSGASTNFVRDERNFNNGLRFVTEVSGVPGEQIFMVPITSDGTTGNPLILTLTEQGGGDGTTCAVTSLLDDPNTASSVRRALNLGYKENDPARTLCSEKISFEKEGVIRLHEPIVLDNTSRPHYTLEKGAGAHGDVVLDGSELPAGSCMVVGDADQLTLRGITLQNPNGPGACVRPNRNGTTLDQMTVNHSTDGVVVQTGARNTLIQNGSFHDNSGFGVKLEDAVFNRVTQNALYQNAQGPLSSPATTLAPTITALVSASATSTSAYDFTLSGTVPSAVEHVEIFRATVPSGATTNYVGRVDSFNNLHFVADVTAQDGEDIFLVAIKADGTTSSVTTYHLDSTNISGGTGDDRLICNVTNLTDSPSAIDSLRRAIDLGYSDNDPATTLCSHKISIKTAGTIVLNNPIVLNNTSRATYTIEKDPTVMGEVVLDGSHLPPGSCMITADANQLIFRDITLQNPNGDGLCIASGRSGNLVDQVTVRNSRNGVIVKTGAQGNTIQDSFFHDNSALGVKLEEATFNRVTQNALYRNTSGPLDSPATTIMPTINSVVSASAIGGSSQFSFTIAGTVPSPIEHMEIYRSNLAPGTTTNFIKSVNSFTSIGFVTDITAQDGEDIFVLGIKADGTTSSVSTFHLDATNASGADGIICSIISPFDDPNAVNSIRRALNLGYLDNNPSTTLCSHKISFKKAGTIVLNEPIDLNNTSRANYILEKDPSVTGEVVLDGSHLPAGSCMIMADANQLTIRDVTLQNPNGDGLCIASNRSGALVDQVTVRNSRNGVVVKPNAEGNVVQNGSFHDNTGFGVKLEDASFNRVTQNAIYRNNLGPIDSPATDIVPHVTALVSAVGTGGSQFTFSIAGTIPHPLEHLEIFRSNLTPGSSTNYIESIDQFNSLRFVANVTAQDGEEIFLVGIKADGTTSAVANFHLSAEGASGGLSGQPGADGTTCNVTSFQDDPNTVNTIGWALNLGYRDNNPSTTLCSQKISFKTPGTIVLQHPIELNNTSRASYTLEKDPSVKGEVIIDASQLPAGACAITADANNLTISNVTVQNPKGDGFCIASNRNGTLLDQVTVRSSRNGVVVRADARGNVIQNGSFHENSEFGIKLEDATYNRVTQNALYHNASGPIESPAVQIAPAFLSSFSNGTVTQDGQMDFTISGQQPMAVNHIEIFRLYPLAGSDSNFIKSVTNFDNLLRFNTDLTASNGEGIFAIAVGNDGTTSSASPFSLNPMAFSSGCSLSQSSSKIHSLSYLLNLLPLVGIWGLRRKALARF